MKQDDALRLAKALKQKLEAQHIPVREVFLYGSMARGDAKADSDVDIAVLFNRDVKEEEYLQREGELIGFFSEFYPKKEINIVNLAVASPLLCHSALLEGNLFI